MILSIRSENIAKKEKIMKRNAFTLVELLVALSIITLMMAFLLPALHSVIEEAYQIQCINNQKQLALGVLSFADDMRGQIPGNTADSTQNEPMKRDWLRGAYYYGSDPTSEGMLAAPHEGTIFPYIENGEVYLCPKVQKGAIFEKDCGNGMFDYSMFLAFSGAYIRNMPKEMRYNLGGAYIENLHVPLFIEENVNNKLNQSVEGGFAWQDSISPRHRENSTISKIDGSARIQKMNLIKNMKVQNIQMHTLDGRWLTVNQRGVKFGDWNSR